MYLYSKKKGAGQWQVTMQGGQPVLQLLFHDGAVQAYTLSFEDGKTFLEGRRWLRTCNPNGPGGRGPAPVLVIRTL